MVFIICFKFGGGTYFFFNDFEKIKIKIFFFDRVILEKLIVWNKV